MEYSRLKIKDIHVNSGMNTKYLVANNASEYAIVYSSDGAYLEATERAAKYLQEYIFKSTGVDLPIEKDGEDLYFREKTFISLGKTHLMEDEGVTFDYSLLSHDGFFIKTIKQNVFIDGVSGRGILYGALDFLERIVGVRFLAYDETFVPKLDQIILPDISIIDNPHFNDRCFSHERTMRDPKFTMEMRMINEYIRMPKEYGGNIGWFNDEEYVRNAVHNTFDYVDDKKYFPLYPEWFYVDNGQPLDLDYSKVGLKEDGSVDESLEISPVKIAIERMFEIISNADPSIKYFMLGQMDHLNNCSCPDCLAQIEKYGRSGMLIRFVNAVAREVRKRLAAAGIKRQYFICTFAYCWSQSAPTKRENGKIVPKHPSVIPEDDVLVRICTIKANQYYSIIDEKQVPETKAMFEEWAVILENRATMIWSYHIRFLYPFLYYPTMQHWLRDFAIYQKMGVEYLYMQSNHFEPTEWKATMETYVASKVLWDNNLDPYMVRKEYVSLYYREIATLVMQFIDNYEKLFEWLMQQDDCPNMINQAKDNPLFAKWYPISFWREQFALIEKMYAVANELSGVEREKMILKIDRIKLTPLFTILSKFDDYNFDDDTTWNKSEMMREFFVLCEKLGVKKAGEWKSLETLKNEWGYNDQ